MHQILYKDLRAHRSFHPEIVLTNVFGSKPLSLLGSSSRIQSPPRSAPPAKSPVANTRASFPLTGLPTSFPVLSSLYSKSLFFQKILLSQYQYCQSGYIILFIPVFGSMAQLTHPELHTSFFASRCVHSESRTAASYLTSTVLGDGRRKGGVSEGSSRER